MTFAWPPALRRRDFRTFAIGYSIASFGSDFTTVATAWQMYELTNSPLDVGLLGAVKLAPLLLFGLVGGVLADAVDRRRLLVIVLAAQFFFSATLFAFAVANAVTPILIYACIGGLSVCAALDKPTRASMVPSLVPSDQLASGIALLNLQDKLGSILSPTLAGIVLAIGGPAFCYAVDALSWVVYLVALLRMRTRSQGRFTRGRIPLATVFEGIRYVRATPVIMSTLLLDLGTQIFGNSRALLPVFARDILHVGSSGLGLMFGATAFGAVIAGSAIGLLPPVRRMGVWVLFGVLLFGLSTAAFAVSQIFVVSLLMLAGAGAGNALSTILRGTIVQIDTPDELRGRVASVTQIFTGTGPKLGQTQSGLVAELFGAPTAGLIGGVAVVAVTLVVWSLSPLRDYRSAHAERLVDRAEPTPA